MTKDSFDPKELIGEAYRIEGIGPAECRSIFIDWALSLSPDVPVPDALAALVARHADARPGHPMSAILREGQTGAAHPARRGGWRGRRGHAN